MKKRLTGIIIYIFASIVAITAAFELGIDPPATHIIGAFAAAGALIAASMLIKVSDGIFFSALIFVFLASPMGSILDLYRSFGPYDKIVHFISGILLAVFGMSIARVLFKRSKVKALSIYAIPLIFSACMFSSGAAGLWEIFEFVADKLAGGQMQRGMVDTVTDMIAGNAGALCYGIWALWKNRIHIKSS